jgi:DNA-binding MarR family transcriptional regulator
MNDSICPTTPLPEPARCPGDETPGERIAFLIQQLGHTVRQHLELAVAEFGLTGPQAMIVRMLEAPLSMQEAAAQLQCDPSNITGIVDRLEARGLVERRVLPSDRRVKQLVLTPEGQSVQACLTAVFDNVPGLAELSDGELDTLRELLERAVASGAPVGTAA